MTREDIKTINDIVHKTIYGFFDICGDEETPMTDKDKLLLEVNKAICNNIKDLEQEPCEDAISRQAVLDTIGNVPDHDDGMVWEALSHAQRDVALLPPVTPKQETAQWKWLRGDVVMCDKCGYVQTLVDFDEDKRGKNYCPSCGRKMVEE